MAEYLGVAFKTWEFWFNTGQLSGLVGRAGAWCGAEISQLDEFAASSELMLFLRAGEKDLERTIGHCVTGREHHSWGKILRNGRAQCRHCGERVVVGSPSMAAYCGVKAVTWEAWLKNGKLKPLMLGRIGNRYAVSIRTLNQFKKRSLMLRRYHQRLERDRRRRPV